MTQTTLEWVEFRDHLQDLCHELFEDQRLHADCVLKVCFTSYYVSITHFRQGVLSFMC